MIHRTQFPVALILTTIALALALYWLQPAGVIPFDDDFGYFRSILLTLQHGYPRTDEWLEPWAASLSAVAALVFLASGSFSATIVVLKILGGAASLAALAIVLRGRGWSRMASTVVAILLVSAPTLLWKWVEFTTLLLYVPCLIGALAAAERKRWSVFFLLWTLAFASRQSAIVWLILPAWEVFRLARTTGERSGPQSILNWRETLPLLLWLAYAIGCAVVLFLLMNRTQSQTVVTFSVLRSFDAVRFVEHALAALGVGFVAIGLGALAIVLAQQTGISWPRRGSRPLVLALAAATALFIVVWMPRLHLSTNGWALSLPGKIYLYLVLLLALTGWVLAEFRLRVSYVIAGGSFVLLVSLRVLLPDYHLIDLFAFAFLAVVPRASASCRHFPAPAIWLRAAAFCAFVALAALQLYMAWVAKNTQDAAWARIVLAEQAMRKGALAPTEIGFAPLGYAGWKLHPWYLAHDERKAQLIAGYLFYVDEKSVIALHGAPGTLEARTPAGGQVIAQGRFPVGFSPNIEFRLVRLGPGGSGRGPSIVEAPVFPLNDAEWRNMANGDISFRERRVRER